jgi:hypothetical protein
MGNFLNDQRKLAIVEDEARMRREDRDRALEDERIARGVTAFVASITGPDGLPDETLISQRLTDPQLFGPVANDLLKKLGVADAEVAGVRFDPNDREQKRLNVLVRQKDGTVAPLVRFADDDNPDNDEVVTVGTENLAALVMSQAAVYAPEAYTRVMQERQNRASVDRWSDYLGSYEVPQPTGAPATNAGLGSVMTDAAPSAPPAMGGLGAAAGPSSEGAPAPQIPATAGETSQRSSSAAVGTDMIPPQQLAQFREAVRKTEDNDAYFNQLDESWLAKGASSFGDMLGRETARLNDFVRLPYTAASGLAWTRDPDTGRLVRRNETEGFSYTPTMDAMANRPPSESTTAGTDNLPQNISFASAPASAPTPPAATKTDPNLLRPDGTKKGDGWLGVQQRPDGGVSTELSIEVEWDGKKTLIPLMVPTLNKQELNWLLTNDVDPKKVPDSIRQKAEDHALGRIRQGLSPFKDGGQTSEQRSSAPSQQRSSAPRPQSVRAVAQSMSRQIQAPTEKERKAIATRLARLMVYDNMSLEAATKEMDRAMGKKNTKTMEVGGRLVTIDQDTGDVLATVDFGPSAADIFKAKNQLEVANAYSQGRGGQGGASGRTFKDSLSLASKALEYFGIDPKKDPDSASWMINGMADATARGLLSPDPVAALGQLGNALNAAKGMREDPWFGDPAKLNQGANLTQVLLNLQFSANPNVWPDILPPAGDLELAKSVDLQPADVHQNVVALATRLKANGMNEGEALAKAKQAVIQAVREEATRRAQAGGQ